MDVKNITVKISSRILGRNRTKNKWAKEHLDDQWDGVLQPLIHALGNESEVKLPLEFYHRTITDMYIMDQHR
jgi:hypothetical protein